MNNEMIRSVVFKLLPVVTAFLVGRGVVNQEIADQIPSVVDWALVGLVTVPTLIRSWAAYSKAKDGAKTPPVDLKPA